ncbi:transcription termination factor 3, mitochondrial-like isoform X1 [Macrosteles quadrilineatus]|uniref:transcription termination factor 3, mitochondrial-like isoform X1 n=1 Tax=Macrosteles quadrilineatus TaxID=74068 RepID=UPI0023E0AAF6|nr:transcription termination factor 3, mitochondrial-like isoform X1 [Macrosteles quadrilineatus]
MTPNLAKFILSFRIKPNTQAAIVSNIWKNCQNPSPETPPNRLIQRYLQTQTRILYHNEVAPSIISESPIPLIKDKSSPSKNINLDTITTSDVAVIKDTETDALDACKEDVSDIGPFASPSFNLAAYVNDSFTLQQFVLLGVKLNVLEKKPEVAEYILKLNFEKQVKPYLRFLHDVGVPTEEFGRFITKNPLIFREDLEDLQIRINYLEAKKFTTEMISRIVTRNPSWLSFSTVDIDKRLGFFQRTFVLSGDEVRALTIKRPTIITYSLGKITVSHFAVKEEMGFSEVETKTLLLRCPKVFDIHTQALKNRFDLIHNLMGVPHEQILEQPHVLLFREFIVKQRHDFLKELGKAQYDPKLPNYVSLETLVHGNDVDFCRNVAKTSINVFNAFLKSR